MTAFLHARDSCGVIMDWSAMKIVYSMAIKSLSHLKFSVRVAARAVSQFSRFVELAGCTPAPVFSPGAVA